MKRIALSIILLLFAAPALPQGDCTECHDCAQPTPEDPCLPECARLMHEPNWSDFALLHSPETVLIEELVARYEAVRFDHKTHAEMSGMGGASCRVCHHDTPAHKIGRCVQCHPVRLTPADVGVIDLKTAYHRQCMFCHREWSHETDCEICHAPLGGSVLDSQIPRDATHAFAHRNLPVKVNFETSHRAGPYVTFDHDVHTKHGVNCQECHAKDACTTCHSGNGLDAPKANGRLHDFSNRSTCSACHEVGQCSVCHSRTPDRPFTHDLTGFPLKSWHAKVECASCHGDRRVHDVMPRQCDGCHNLWEDQAFNHATTVNIDLGEEHEGMDCVDCHQDAGYSAPPACDGCHDDGRGPDLLN